MNNNSILDSVKAQLGICEEDTSFDKELIIHINSVLAHVTQIGVGPSEGFAITDSSEQWDQLIQDSMTLQNVKSFVFLRVKLLFDPSASATIMNAQEAMAKEMEWRLYAQAEHESKSSSDEGSKELVKHSEYLYSMKFPKLNYLFGKKFIEERFKPSFGMCSSVRNGNFYGRNLDWYYNTDVDLVVKVGHTMSHFASIGVVGANSLLTKETINSGAYKDYLDALPFMIVDGINEKGVFVNTNVVHLEKGRTIGTIPLVQKKDSVCMLMLARYILDNYKSAKEAVEAIRDYISVYGTKQLWEMGMEAHYMIGDNTRTYILEFVDNQVVIGEKPYLTNFYLADVVFNQDGKVYTPETQDADHNAIDTNHITPLGMGLERWNTIVDRYSSSDSEIGMKNLMVYSLDYRLAYALNGTKWYTEFTGQNSHNYVTTKSTPEEYAYVMGTAHEMFLNRKREVGPVGTWHTTHTTIYNISSLYMILFDSSEDGKEHMFML